MMVFNEIADSKWHNFGVLGIDIYNKSHQEGITDDELLRFVKKHVDETEMVNKKLEEVV